ncbi:MAG: hypothetical protein K0S01_356 [Herbinix sp.]|jgi:beta-N-acetylhexosaminidase|nr:hypothetical protein [Herbinix sp.]
MKNDIFALYNACFPNMKIRFEAFLNKLDYDHSEIIVRKDKNEVIGFSIVKDNAILLLCVNPKLQNKGYGTELLQQSEQNIKAQGFDKIILGCGSTYLFQGVPMGTEEKTHLFFEKRGYRSDGISVNMTMRLNDFSINTIQMPKAPDTVLFRYATAEDKAKLLPAVAEVEAEWVKYYEHSEEPILIAVEGSDVLGFEIISANMDTFYSDERDTIGAVGCVGVVPQVRKRGIGLQLVALGIEVLKKNDCDEVFIGYTYYENWYALLGHKTSERFWMGYKNI